MRRKPSLFETANSASLKNKPPHTHTLFPHKFPGDNAPSRLWRSTLPRSSAPPAFPIVSARAHAGGALDNAGGLPAGSCTRTALALPSVCVCSRTQAHLIGLGIHIVLLPVVRLTRCVRGSMPRAKSLCARVQRLCANRPRPLKLNASICSSSESFQQSR